MSKKTNQDEETVKAIIKALKKDHPGLQPEYVSQVLAEYKQAGKAPPEGGLDEDILFASILYDEEVREDIENAYIDYEMDMPRNVYSYIVTDNLPDYPIVVFNEHPRWLAAIRVAVAILTGKRVFCVVKNSREYREATKELSRQHQ